MWGVMQSDGVRAHRIVKGRKTLWAIGEDSDDQETVFAAYPLDDDGTDLMCLVGMTEEEVVTAARDY
jgi:hypothetical protein